MKQLMKGGVEKPYIYLRYGYVNTSQSHMLNIRLE